MAISDHTYASNFKTNAPPRYIKPHIITAPFHTFVIPDHRLNFKFSIQECLICNLSIHPKYRQLFNSFERIFDNNKNICSCEMTNLKLTHSIWTKKLPELFNKLDIASPHRKFIEKIPYMYLKSHFSNAGNLLCKFNKRRIKTSGLYYRLIEDSTSLSNIFANMQRLIKKEPVFKKHFLNLNTTRRLYCILLTALFKRSLWSKKNVLLIKNSNIMSYLRP